MRKKIPIVALFLLLFLQQAGGCDTVQERFSFLKAGSAAETGGRYSDAIRYYEKALTVFRELGDIQGVAVSLNNIGVVYEATGQYNKALTYLRESLEIDNVPQVVSSTLNNIGEVYEDTGRYDKALAKFQAALNIDQMLHHPGEIRSDLIKIGAVYDALGRHNKALSNFQAALEISLNAGPGQ